MWTGASTIQLFAKEWIHWMRHSAHRGTGMISGQIIQYGRWQGDEPVTTSEEIFWKLPVHQSAFMRCHIMNDRYHLDTGSVSYQAANGTQTGCQKGHPVLNDDQIWIQFTDAFCCSKPGYGIDGMQPSENFQVLWGRAFIELGCAREKNTRVLQWKSHQGRFYSPLLKRIWQWRRKMCNPSSVRISRADYGNVSQLCIDRFFYLVMIAVMWRSGNEFTEESCQK